MINYFHTHHTLFFFSLFFLYRTLHKSPLSLPVFFALQAPHQIIYMYIDFLNPLENSFIYLLFFFKKKGCVNFTYHFIGGGAGEASISRLLCM